MNQIIRRNSLVAVCALGICALGIAHVYQAEGTVFKFKKNQELTYVDKTVISMEEGLMGLIEMESETTTKYTVLESGDKSSRLRSKIIKDVSEDPMGGHSMSRLGMTQEFTVSARGNGSNFKTTDRGEMPEMHGMHGMDESKMKMPPFGLVFPEKALTKGDTWTSNHAMFGTDGKTETTYTFTGFKTVKGRRLAVITSKSKSSGVMHMSGPDGEMEATMEMDGTAKYYFDVERGVLTESVTTTNMLIIADMGDMEQTRVTTRKLSD